MHSALRNYADLFRRPVAAPRVLVVDDEEAVCAFVSRVLRGAGYQVQTAFSGSHALGLIDDGARFDVVISDVRMPSMSGPQFVERLRRREADVKILYLTGYNEQLFSERPALWAEEAFLDKPCSVRGLLESVALLMYQHTMPPPRATWFNPQVH